jgi:hypothetical protein
MSQILAVGDPAARAAAAQRFAAEQPRAGAHGRAIALDSRRALQLALGGLWVLDAVLQFQPSMFSHDFPQMLADSAQGNPAFVARPITWSAGIIGHHEVALNAIFAVIQLLLGLGIAWRPAIKLALAGSVAWSLAVWWLGEGLGGVLAGTASPVNGAPGAVPLYGLLAVLLWPADRDTAAPFTAARAVGRRAAQASWLVIWLGLAVLALLPASRTIAAEIADTTPGEPTWLAWLDAHAASALTQHGQPAAIVLAVGLAIVAFGVFLPRRAARAAIILAVALAAVLWLAQGLGEILTGSATDPDSGPLLALLALAFWPLAAPARSAPASSAAPSAAPARSAPAPSAAPAPAPEGA